MVMTQLKVKSLTQSNKDFKVFKKRRVKSHLITLLLFMVLSICFLVRYWLFSVREDKIWFFSSLTFFLFIGEQKKNKRRNKRRISLQPNLTNLHRLSGKFLIMSLGIMENQLRVPFKPLDT